jgi:hypothetical protein
VTALLLANAAATWGMVGVIWFVQLVHYPLFPGYAGGDFRAVMADHQRQTFRVVFPLMLTELVTSVALLAVAPGWLTAAGVGCVAVWGVSTVVVQIPLHERLERDGFETGVARRLVRANWLRTAAWTAHGGVCAGLLAGCRSG